MSAPKSLLGKVATRKNLELAWHDVSRFARPLSHGMSNQTIDEFRANLKSNTEKIRMELLSGNYKFGNVRAVTIKKKSGKKRPLRIPDVRDRVVQRAITRILEKHLVKKFNLDNLASHAYLRKKGVRTAITRMLSLHNKGYSVILEADIERFFDTVDTNKLLNNMIFPNLPDNSINHLIENAFKTEIGNKDELPDDDFELYPESSAGLPQGGYLSPLFSNIYLSEFDHKMLRENFQLIRYADDFIIMCKTIEEAENAYNLAKKILEGDLNLTLHPRADNDKTAKTRVIKVTQTTIKFLGVQFNGVRIWPDPVKRKQLFEKLSSINKNSRHVRELLNSINSLLEGWVAAYGFCDLNKNYINEIDDAVGKALWIGLKNFGWNLKPMFLNKKQRLNSGIKSIHWHLNVVRGNLGKERKLFSKYWTKA